MHRTHPNAVFYLSASKNKALQSGEKYSVTVYERSHSFPSRMCLIWDMQSAPQSQAGCSHPGRGSWAPRAQLCSRAAGKPRPELAAAAPRDFRVAPSLPAWPGTRWPTGPFSTEFPVLPNGTYRAWLYPPSIPNILYFSYEKSLSTMYYFLSLLRENFWSFSSNFTLPV